MQTSTFLGHPALVKSRWLIGSLTFGVLSYWVLPKLLTLEKKKWMRLGYAGLNMMRIYKFSSSDISTQHKHASEYLRDALLSNGGIYVKFGQFLASLDIIVPD